MVSEETSELAQNGASLAPMTMFAAPLKTAPLKTPRLGKIGARNNEKDQARIQHVHDTSVELGAVWREPFALSARSIIMRTMRKVLPERVPPARQV